MSEPTLEVLQVLADLALKAMKNEFQILAGLLPSADPESYSELSQDTMSKLQVGAATLRHLIGVCISLNNEIVSKVGVNAMTGLAQPLVTLLNSEIGIPDELTALLLQLPTTDPAGKVSSNIATVVASALPLVGALIGESLNSESEEIVSKSRTSDPAKPDPTTPDPATDPVDDTTTSDSAPTPINFGELLKGIKKEDIESLFQIVREDKLNKNSAIVKNSTNFSTNLAVDLESRKKIALLGTVLNAVNQIINKLNPDSDTYNSDSSSISSMIPSFYSSSPRTVLSTTVQSDLAKTILDELKKLDIDTTDLTTKTLDQILNAASDLVSKEKSFFTSQRNVYNNLQSSKNAVTVSNEALQEVTREQNALVAKAKGNLSLLNDQLSWTAKLELAIKAKDDAVNEASNELISSTSAKIVAQSVVFEKQKAFFDAEQLKDEKDILLKEAEEAFTQANNAVDTAQLELSQIFPSNNNNPRYMAASQVLTSATSALNAAQTVKNNAFEAFENAKKALAIADKLLKDAKALLERKDAEIVVAVNKKNTIIGFNDALISDIRETLLKAKTELLIIHTADSFQGEYRDLKKAVDDKNKEYDDKLAESASTLKPFEDAIIKAGKFQDKVKTVLTTTKSYVESVYQIKTVDKTTVSFQAETIRLQLQKTSKQTEFDDAVTALATATSNVTTKKTLRDDLQTAFDLLTTVSPNYDSVKSQLTAAQIALNDAEIAQNNADNAKIRATDALELATLEYNLHDGTDASKIATALLIYQKTVNSAYLLDMVTDVTGLTNDSFDWIALDNTFDLVAYNTAKTKVEAYYKSQTDALKVKKIQIGFDLIEAEKDEAETALAAFLTGDKKEVLVQKLRTAEILRDIKVTVASTKFEKDLKTFVALMVRYADFNAPFTVKKFSEISSRIASI